MGMDGVQAWLQRSRGTAPLWPLLLVLAAILFGVQSVYANMLAANRSQGADATIHTGRIVRRRFGQRKAVGQREEEWA